MKKDRAKELIPVMQAYVDGAQIQYKPSSNNAWIDTTDPIFMTGNEYRIKPLPREIFVVQYPSKDLASTVHLTERTAMVSAAHTRGASYGDVLAHCTVVKFREVIEE